MVIGNQNHHIVHQYHDHHLLHHHHLHCQKMVTQFFVVVKNGVKKIRVKQNFVNK